MGHARVPPTAFRTVMRDAFAGVALVVSAALCSAVASNSGVQGELVLSKQGDKQYHRPGCDAVRDGKQVVALPRAQAEARGLTSHPACDPATASIPAPEKKASPVTVRIDSGRYYHRDTCGKLAKDARTIPLEEAGKKYWPCPNCKPPIRPRKEGPRSGAGRASPDDGRRSGTL
jgi:hypothetical protein